MRILGLVVGGLLSITGGLFLVGTLWNAISIYVFSDELPKGAGAALGPMALAAVPLVIGLVILSKCQKRPPAKDSK
jgi:hypothetical protein